MTLVVVDPSEAFQRAVFQTLRAEPALRALLGEARRGIYDSVPEPNENETEAEFRKRVPFPYLTIGEDQVLDDSTGCATAFEVFCTIHIWSRVRGKIEAKKLGGVVRTLLDAELTIDGFRCTDWSFRDSQYLQDPDGLTTHGILTFRYLLDVNPS